MWSGNLESGATQFLSPPYCEYCHNWHRKEDAHRPVYCFQCKNYHEYEEACILHSPQLYQHYYPYCIQCGGGCGAGACRTYQPWNFQHCQSGAHLETALYYPEPPQFVPPPPFEPLTQEVFFSWMSKLECMLEKFFSARLDQIAEEMRELNSDILRLTNKYQELSQSWISADTPEPETEFIPPEIEEVQTVTSSGPVEPEIDPVPAPQETDSYIPHWLPAVLEMQKGFFAKMAQEQQEAASQVAVMEEEVPEPREVCTIQEPSQVFHYYEDSDSESDLEETVPAWMEPQPISNSRHDLKDTDIEHSGCTDEETVLENVSTDMDELEEGIPTHPVEEFSKSYVDQVCEELERLLFGDSDKEVDHGHSLNLCSMDCSRDIAQDIEKGQEITQCGGTNKLPTRVVQHQESTGYELKFHCPTQASRDEFHRQDFVKILTDKPVNDEWKLIKKKKCKTKEIIFHNFPPCQKNECAREMRIIEKRWWKKKKWRDKEAFKFLKG